jgi:hypothetical protein
MLSTVSMGWMMRRKLLGFWLLLPLLSPWLMAAELKFGRGAVDITPEVGTPMQAPQRPPFEIRLAQTPHDALQVKALFLEVEGERAALVTCDVTSLPLAIVRQAREMIESRLSIPAEHLMISATHTHTAPQLRPRYITQAETEARQKTEDYLRQLPERIAAAVQRAVASAEAATVDAGIGQTDGLSYNRRFRMRDGSIQTNPGKEQPELVQQIVAPDGPVDPQVAVVSFVGGQSQPLATLVNYSLHLDTIGGAAPSADFAYFLAKHLSEAGDPGMLTVFSLGAAGNINHYDLLNAHGPYREKSRREAARIGTILAAEVLQTLRHTSRLPIGPLRVRTERVRLAIPPEKGKILSEQYPHQSQFFDGEVDVFQEKGECTFEAEVQVIALGDQLAWVGFPGEMFVELGLALKEASPFPWTIIHCLANGSIGYVPNRKAYPRGAYEATASRCAPGSGEKLVDTASRLLVEVCRPNEIQAK